MKAMSLVTGLAWLCRRETLRVSKLWTQTVLAPVIASILFILVFGLSLGGRIDQVGGVDYEVFIVPGLITMAHGPGGLRQQLVLDLPGALRPLRQRRALRARCPAGR